MKFFCENVWHRLRTGKTYLLFFLEMVIGSAVLLVCINALFTGQKTLKEYARMNMREKAAITTSSAGFSSKWGENTEIIRAEGYIPPLLPEIMLADYTKLCRKFKDRLEFAYSEYFYIDMYLPESNEITTFNLYCMEDVFFEELFGADTSRIKDREKTAYLGDSVYEFLEHAGKAETVFTTSVQFGIRDGRLWIDGQDLFQAEKVETVNKNEVESIPYVWQDGAEKLKNVLILPLSFGTQMEKILLKTEAGVNAYSQLKAGTKDGTPDFKALNQLLSYLTQHGDGTVKFGFSNQYLEMEKRYEDLSGLVWYWFWIGASFAIMAGGGITGGLMLIQYRRRRSTAVSYFCGASKRRIYAELFCEIQTVLLAGTVVGSVMAYYFISSVEFVVMKLEWFWRSFWLTAAGTLVIGGLTFLITYLYDGKKSYLSQVREC